MPFRPTFTQHIPPKGAHLVRYYGWYSNKARGMRRKAAEAEAAKQQYCCGRGLPTRPCSGEATEPATSTRCSQSWAILIKRVYEVDPLKCARCGGVMKVIAFIEPPRGDLIEKIYCVTAGYGTHRRREPRRAKTAGSMSPTPTGRAGLVSVDFPAYA